MKKLDNPLKGLTKYGWHFEQNVYTADSVTRAVKVGGVVETLLKWYCMKRYKIGQQVGDRGRSYWSFKNYAFTVPANPMSDRMQLVFQYEEITDSQ